MIDSMPSTKPPSRRRTPEEAVALVSEWRSSGLSRGTFCEQRGIPLSTLSSCQQRELAMRSKRHVASAGFVEVRPHPLPACVGLTLEIDGGFRLSGLDVSSVVTLVSALRGELR